MADPAPRRNIALVVGLTFEPSGATAKGVSVNISETGVLVRASKLMPRGTIVRLAFKEFSAGGEVIWTKETSEGYLLGMRFVSMGRRGGDVVRGLLEFPDETS